MRHSSVDRRRQFPVFQISLYNSLVSANEKEEYLQELLFGAMQRRKVSDGLLCVNQLVQLIADIMIPLRTKQIVEVYVYGACSSATKSNEKGNNNILNAKSDQSRKIAMMLEQKKERVDVVAVAEWLSDKIQKKEINFPSFASKKQYTNKKQQPRQELSKTAKVSRLPSLIGTASNKLQEQLKYLIDIFDEMETTRQNSGLIPINDDNEENDIEVPCTNIPYDPELYKLNTNLCKLKIKAEERLSRIIELARDDQRIRRKLEEAIERFQKSRIEANEKIGRFGAMKAQERLNWKKQRQLQKLQQLQLNEGQDLVHAAKLYSLLMLPQIKMTRIIS